MPAISRLLLIMLLGASVAANAARIEPRQLADVGGVPWGMALVGEGKLLFTRRAGSIGLLDIASGRVGEIRGAPDVLAEGQGGLLDVAVEPSYRPGGWVYFTYSKDVGGRGATTLARARLDGDRLVDWRDLLVTDSATNAGQHFGSRVTFDGEGHLFFGIGDRGDRPNSQNLGNHAGAVLRLNLDGSVPADNPFVGQRDVRPEIWSYGHRNPQGLTFDPVNKRLWEIEHGPRGGDEINLVEKGANYGWPVISYGKEYWGPISVGEGTERAGMQQPVKYYVPSIAPGSLMVYQGTRFPEWTGALMAGALKLRHLNIVKVNDQGEEISEDRVLEDLGERIRALAQDAQGFIYFSTDSGKIYRLETE
jgi:glucose/arabinose dehydrogenase